MHKHKVVSVRVLFKERLTCSPGSMVPLIMAPLSMSFISSSLTSVSLHTTNQGPISVADNHLRVTQTRYRYRSCDKALVV